MQYIIPKFCLNTWMLRTGSVDCFKNETYDWTSSMKASARDLDVSTSAATLGTELNIGMCSWYTD